MDSFWKIFSPWWRWKWDSNRISDLVDGTIQNMTFPPPIAPVWCPANVKLGAAPTFVLRWLVDRSGPVECSLHYYQCSICGHSSCFSVGWCQDLMSLGRWSYHGAQYSFERIALFCQEIPKSTAATKASTACRLNAPGWFLLRPGHTLSSCVHLLCQKTVYPKYGHIWHNLFVFEECIKECVQCTRMNGWIGDQEYKIVRPGQRMWRLGEADAATLQVRWINVQLCWNAIMKPCCNKIP